MLPANDSVVVGAGDDCAVLDVGIPDRQLLFKTDAVVEGIHFQPEAPPEKVGHKALARCLSDIAAMGGSPGSAVITLGLPLGRDPGWSDQVYAGLGAIARKYGVAIVGGETTTSPERAFISVALLGSVARGKAVLRSGARPGDAIFVTGELGGSLDGKHLDFEPRLAEAQWLCSQFNIHSMIDLSDGLAGDLPHILKASGVGAELLAKALPVSRAAKHKAKRSHGTKTALMMALTDGEDFELLFTVAPSDAVPLLDGWKAMFPGVNLTCVGRIQAEAGIQLRDKTGVRPMMDHGFVHLA
ncbi:MAG: thiamine-phosphate kinase [Verrucomicrobia bacterium]|nr:thiamine-phosphate kinase [Verrucomicrobiota bacterium]